MILKVLFRIAMQRHLVRTQEQLIDNLGRRQTKIPISNRCANIVAISLLYVIVINAAGSDEFIRFCKQRSKRE